jgi:tetratricopeptide (TPR) repeat protein
LKARAYEHAHELAMRALRLDAGAARSYFVLAMIAADHGNPAKTLEILDRAIALDANYAAALAQRARTHLTLVRQADARTDAERAAALQPTDALTLDTIGVVFSRTGLHASAISFFQRAVALAPQSASYWYNLAAASQFLGKFEDAERAYKHAIERAPDDHRAYSALVQLKRQTPGDNLIPALEALFDERDAERALHIGHALAKSFEDLGEYDRSLAWLGRAKAARRREVAGQADDAALFAAAEETARWAKTAGGDALAAPIFVVGLPRTGTTLVDRILSSHRDVRSVGELGAFSLAIKQLTATPSSLVLDPVTLREAHTIDYAEAARRYLSAAAPLAQGAPRFVDKMPLNFFYGALIHRVFPQARIVALRRHPMDAALSNYRQLFATSFTYYNYAFSLEETARYVAGYERLMRAFARALRADRFMQIEYEALVSNQETQTRRLLAFCGLDWDPACLNFHENDAPVATASSVQVRQPLYASSVGRWKRYAGGLEGASAVLRQAGLL